MATEQEIIGLIARIEPGLPAEQVAAAIDAVECNYRRAKELKVLLEQALYEHIEATGKPIVLGPVRWYVGPVRKTDCRDEGECLQSLIEQFGPAHVGKNFLSSGAFKHGAISKEVDGETFARLFEVREEMELKEGKAERVKKLQKVNEDFVR